MLIGNLLLYADFNLFQCALLNYFNHHILQFDCVIMVKGPDRITGMWKVENCEEKRGFVCKRNIGKWTQRQHKLSQYH